MDFMTYSERLGIGFDDSFKQQAFINRMYNVVNDSSIKFSFALEELFASEIGMRFVPTYTNDINHKPVEVLSNAWKYIDYFTEFRLKLASIVALVNLYKLIERTYEYKLLYEGLIDSLEMSHILYQVEKEGNQIFIFPKGNPMLDKGEVLSPLKLLDDYPKSKHSFIDALKMYNDLRESNASTVADSFRKALESFFQEFFKSDKSIEHFKPEYGNYIKELGGSKELAGNFVSILNAYTNYNNNNAKHHDRASILFLEYLLYETGNIIRLLITLRNEEKQLN